MYVQRGGCHVGLKKIETENLSCLLQSPDESKLALKVREISDDRGRGVFTQTDRSRKSFICEYAGDTANKEDAERTADEYVQEGAKNFYQY
jgi:hypothetical protein